MNDLDLDQHSHGNGKYLMLNRAKKACKIVQFFWYLFSLLKNSCTYLNEKYENEEETFYSILIC